MWLIDRGIWEQRTLWYRSSSCCKWLWLRLHWKSSGWNQL